MQNTLGQLSKHGSDVVLSCQEPGGEPVRAGTTEDNLARNPTNNQDGLKVLRGKYICPVFFIVVFQDVN